MKGYAGRDQQQTGDGISSDEARKNTELALPPGGERSGWRGAAGSPQLSPGASNALLA